MAKLLAGIVAGVFVFGASAAFAYKLEPMDKEQRTELRERADRLAAERDRESHRTSDRDSHRGSDAKHRHMTHKSSSATRERETSSGR
jgi:hypothetical protein